MVPGKRNSTNLKCSLELLRNEPLHERVPIHDDEGNALGDFMMLFPGLRDQAESIQSSKVDILAEILSQYKEVVFVDLNVPLNLLWVSIRSIQGIRLEIASAIQEQVPGAKLVSHV